MNFLYKCYFQKILSKIPQGEKINFLFQRYIFKGLPLSDEQFLEKVNAAYFLITKFKKHSSISHSDIKYYEFGAGWDLITPIAMGLSGFNVNCIDIRYLVSNGLITNTLNRYEKFRTQIPFDYKISLDNILQKKIKIRDLKNILNINYIAPLDARDTEFESDSYDFISSSATFEHIPEQDLLSILQECYRILKTGGILTLITDYKDHWSYFDNRLSVYNFLTYSPEKWKKYNPSLMYQNRLRHKDYIEIIRKTNFSIAEEIPTLPSVELFEEIKKLDINESYRKYTLEELSIVGSIIILKK